MTTAHLEVRHGYTLSDLNDMAAAACRADRSLASDAHTRYDAAWSAIAEHLASVDEQPGWQELVQVGWQAIYREVREMRHVFGFRDKDGTTEVASSPRYVQYWWQPPQRPEEGLLERMALHEILTALPEIDREVIVALAVHGDYQAAAESIGLRYSTLTQRLTVARRRFRAQWFAPDTAPPIKGTDRRVGSRTKALATHCRGGKGPHEMTPENTYRRPNPKPGKRGERVCRACEQERGRARHAARKAAA